MKIELDLLHNAYDYLNIALENYRVASEYGMHDEERSNYQKKLKWKISFVSLVQATELLLKEVLYRVHSNLIYQDIDSVGTSADKTVTINQAIKRINNFSHNCVCKEHEEFIRECSKLRNEFIHYKATIASEQIMKKFSMLYCIFEQLNADFIGDDITYYNESSKSTCLELKIFNERFTVYRGREVEKRYVEDVKKIISENEKFHYYIAKDNKKVHRVRFGNEKQTFGNKYLEAHGIENRTLNEVFTIYSDYTYCDDCLAKQGEYHNVHCDLEICPVCFKQLITCECIERLSEE